jgi:glycine/D-amino acid oxidase-like deaminating enzyme
VDAVSLSETGLRELSLWWDTLPGPIEARPALPGSTTADVVIVGAGYTGLWTAYYLAKQDPAVRIVILEREVAGFGASGRNGGWCSALFPASVGKVARTSDRASAIALQRAMNETVDEVGRVCQVEGIDAHFVKGGTIRLARTPLQLQRAKDEIVRERSWGFDEDDISLLGAVEAREAVGATDILGATYSMHCARIHPTRLVRGLADAVAALGVTIHEHTAATSIEPGVVRTAYGDVRAPVIIRATEGYTPQLPGYERAVVPVYSLMIATEPLPQSFWEEAGLRRMETFADFRHLIIYGQRTADDRFAFGGRGAPYHYGSSVRPEFDRDAKVHAGLWRVLCDLFPSVRKYAVTHQWGGPLGVPRDWYASVGLDRSTGIGTAGGYVGDGVGTSNLAGRTLADLILGNDTALTRLPWVNHKSPQWEPEPARWTAVNAGLQVMSRADNAEARSGRPSKQAAMFHRFLGE